MHAYRVHHARNARRGYSVPPAYPGPWACRPWAPVAPLSDNVSVARSVHGRSPVLRNVIRMNAASRPRGVVRHDKQLTPNSSTRRSRHASPAQAGGEQSRMMRAHQIPERVQTATQELSHQALRRHTRKPATWP